MKSWRHNRKPDPSEAPATPATAGSGLTLVDGAIGATLLAVTLTVCVPVAMRLRGEVRELDAERDRALRHSRSLRTAIQHLETRRVTLNRLRKVVDRYVTDVQAKPIVPWTTAVGELSRRRPAGVWTTRLAGDGPRFRAYVSAAQPELVSTYTQSLRQSSYVDFASGDTAAAPAAGSAQVVGRLMGE